MIAKSLVLIVRKDCEAFNYHENQKTNLKSIAKAILLFATSQKIFRNFIIALAENVPESREFARKIPIPNHLKSFLFVKNKKVIFTSPTRCSFSKQLYWDNGKIFPLQDRMTLEIFLRISGLCSNAFDILPEAASISFNNALSNKISSDRLIIENIGLADSFSIKSVPARAYSPSLMFAYALDSSISANNNHEEIDIRVITLDYYVEQIGVENLSGSCIFKLDVEGFESNVLDGSYRTIQNLQPFIICEIIGKSNPKKVQNALKDHGYRYFLITDIGLVHSDQVYCHNNFRDWLFVPKNNDNYREVLTELFGSTCETKKVNFIQLKHLKS